MSSFFTSKKKQVVLFSSTAIAVSSVTAIEFLVIVMLP